MSYQVLARKWRPKTFQQLVGQESVVQALVNGLDNNRVHHGFVLTGTRGVGKTTIARILAKCLNCQQGVSSTPCGECSVCMEIDEGRFPDMREVDAASRTGVDDMRELLESAQYAPVQGRFKVFIIDEVHMLSKNSFNALLKTLEEPPDHVKFVLATTDPEKIPVTILSRCLRFNLRRLLPDEIMGYLEKIMQEESIESEPDAIGRIARAADGSMRDALSLLDQAIAYGGGVLKEDDVANMMGSVDHAHLVQLVDALAATDAPAILEIVRELSAQARDLEGVLKQLAEIFHRMSLVQLVPDYQDPERSDWESIQALATKVSPEDVQLFYQIAIQGKRDLGLAPDPRSGLEMSLMRMLAFRPAQADKVPTPSGNPAAGRGSADNDSPAAGHQVDSAAAGASSVAQRSDSRPSVSQPATDSGRDQPLFAPETEQAAPSAKSAAAPAVGAEEPAAPAALMAAQTKNLGDAWRQLLEQLELSGAVRELARNITLESCESSHWQFAIPDEVEHLGKPGLVRQLQTALGSQLGEEVRVAIHTVAEPVATPAAVSQQAEVRRLSEAEKAIHDDPCVRALKERFDAHIVEDSIQPIQ